MEFRKIKLLGVLLFASSMVCYSQSKWVSAKYGYKVEIPEGFSHKKAVGANVDFKVVNGNAVIVMVVRQLLPEDVDADIMDFVEDIDEYMEIREELSQEDFDDYTITKYGTSHIDGIKAVWYDDLIDKDTIYSKNYQFVKGVYYYSISMSCPSSEKNYWGKYWYRFRESIKLK